MHSHFEHCLDLYNSRSYSTLLTYLIAHKAQLDKTADFWALLGLTRKALDLSIETVLSAYYKGLSIDPHVLIFILLKFPNFTDIDHVLFITEAIKLSFLSLSIGIIITLLSPPRVTLKFNHFCLHQAILLEPDNPGYLSDYVFSFLDRS